MPIPRTRDELVERFESTWTELWGEIEDLDADGAELACTEDWTIRQLLCVRAWWTRSVIDWVEAGRRGGAPELPAPGFSWRETPRLNARTVSETDGEEWEAVRRRLRRAVRRARRAIDSLSDEELLEVGAFPWADRWPLARWISINTATQYASARTLVRKALRARPSGGRPR